VDTALCGVVAGGLRGVFGLMTNSLFIIRLIKFVSVFNRVSGEFDKVTCKSCIDEVFAALGSRQDGF
jgi:hypothetical protein